MIRDERNIPDEDEDEKMKLNERNVFEEAISINTIQMLWTDHGFVEEEVLRDHEAMAI